MFYFLTNSYASTQLHWYLSEREATLAAQKYISKVITFTLILLSFTIHPVKVIGDYRYE
jgi:hypothetical protein